MAIPVVCKFCQFSFNVTDDFAGRTIKCPECSASVIISSGLEFSDSEIPLKMVNESFCKICGAKLETDLEVCEICGGNIKSHSDLNVKNVSNIYLRPKKKRHYSFTKIIILLMMMASTIGISFLVRNYLNPEEIPIEKLIPKDTSSIIYFDFRKTSPYEKKLFQTLIYERWLEKLFPKELNLNCSRDIHSLCLFGNDKRFFIPFLTKHCENFSAALIIKGKFNFSKMKSLSHSKLYNSKYQNFVILLYPIKINSHAKEIYCTFLDSKTAILSTHLEHLRKIINVYQKDKKEKLVLDEKFLFHSNHFLRMQSKFSEDFLPEDLEKGLKRDVLSKSSLITLSLSNISNELQAKFTLSLIENDFEEKNILMPLRGYFENLSQDLSKISKERTENFIKFLSLAQMSLSKNSFGLLFQIKAKEKSKIVDSVIWAVDEGTDEVDLIREINQVKNISSMEEKCRYLEKFTRNDFYKKRPSFRVSQYKKYSHLAKNMIENFAYKKYSQLLKNTANDSFARWQALAKFPMQLYSGTKIAKKVIEERKNIKKHFLEKVKEIVKKLKRMKNENIQGLENIKNDFFASKQETLGGYE